MPTLHFKRDLVAAIQSVWQAAISTETIANLKGIMTNRIEEFIRNGGGATK